MKKNRVLLLCGFGVVVAACDLQPKITSLPDSVGDFITVRYPALLADPNTQPEIYNSAASDYGVFASPELYGSVTGDDYVLYASVSDYIIPPQVDENVTVPGEEVAVPAVVAETPASTSDKNSESVSDKKTEKTVALEQPDEYLMVPMYGAIDLSDVQVALPDTVTVARGDTLYSIARANNTTIADLVRINKIESPSSLAVGQVLRLHDASNATYVAVSSKTPDVAASASTTPATNAPATASQTRAAITKAATPSTPKAEESVVIKHPTPTTTKVELQEVTVGPGDTLYSISRKYSVPVNDLAVMNDIAAPFGLRTGQVIKVPNLASPDVHVATSVAQPKSAKLYGSSDAIVVKTSATQSAPVDAKAKHVDSAKADTPKPTAQNTPDVKKTTEKTPTTPKVDTPKVKNTEKQKISSDPAKKLPKIAARSSSKFSWPVRGKVVSHFGAKSDGLFNDGINIVATRGTAVKAAENGVVAYAGNEVKGMGNLVIVQHADGWMTVYGHLDSMDVRRGTKVTVGQKIGTVGATGRIDTPQLHFETRKGTKAYDPVAYLKK